MGSQRTFNPTPIGFGMLLLVLILSLEVMGAEASGWFGGSQNKKDPETPLARFVGGKAAFELDSIQDLGKGKELYEQSTSLMSGHSCWQLAYAKLRTGCRGILNDETKKARLALGMADCFLQVSGRDGLRDCPSSDPVARCVTALDEHNHKIFLAFFINVGSMCHYLQSDEFKLEAEKAVKLLQDSTHLTQDKLERMNMNLDAQHSTLMEHTGHIIEGQEIIQKGHIALQESIQQGMEKMQEGTNLVRSGLDDVLDLQKDVARKHDEFRDAMGTELSDLNQRTNDLGNSIGSLYASVEDMAEKTEAGRVNAMKSMKDLQDLHEDGRKQTKQDFERFSIAASKVYDEFRGWQAQMRSAHVHIAETASEISKRHEEILLRQSQVNTFIMDVLEGLIKVQHGWIFESRIFRFAGIYAGVSVLIFIATATRKTRSARLGLYIGLFCTIICEIYVIRNGLKTASRSKSDNWLPSNVWLLRSAYCAFALALLLYSFSSYRDYEVLNHRMLAEHRDLMNAIARDMKNLPQMVKASMGDAIKGLRLPEEAVAQRRIRFVEERTKPPVSAAGPKEKRFQSSPY